MNTRVQVLRARLLELLEDAHITDYTGGYVDDDGSGFVCVDGWFNVTRLAEKLIEEGYDKDK